MLVMSLGPRHLDDPTRVRLAPSSMITKAVLGSCDLFPVTPSHVQEVSPRLLLCG